MSLEQQVRYCKTSDGVNIAYTTYGEGPPIIVPPNILNTHLQLELNYSTVRGFFERLSQRLQVIRYDARGTGMSQRDVVDFSAEAFERDVLAVADRLGAERFAMYAHIVAGSGPTAFAAKHPDRVTSLVWWVGQSIRIDPDTLREMNAIVPLMETEWPLYTNIAGRLISGWDSPEASVYAALVREGSSPEARRAAFREYFRMESRHFATDDVVVPTLVAHLAAAPAATSFAQSIAAGISTAHVIAIPGLPTSKSPYVDDNEVLVAAIADFVDATSGDAPMAAVRVPELQLGAMRAILFTDIVGHTEMMSRLGDAKGRDVLREHERITRETLAEHGGAEVKAMGDGFMAWFSSAQKAVECAVALQRNLSRGPASSAPKGEGSTIEGVSIRVGLNAGEPIEEDGDLFGTSVITASRICAQAGGGEIVVSDVVRQLVAGKGFEFSDRGAVALKGFEEPVRLFEVRWRE